MARKVRHIMRDTTQHYVAELQHVETIVNAAMRPLHELSIRLKEESALLDRVAAAVWTPRPTTLWTG
jgi:hypothetical protein